MQGLFVLRCSIRRPVHHIRYVFNASKELESRERALVGGGEDRIVAQHGNVCVCVCVCARACVCVGGGMNSMLLIYICIGQVNSKGKDRAVG